MKKKLKKLKNAYQVCVDEMTAMLDGTDDALTAEEQTAFDELKAKAASLKTQIANCESLMQEKAEAERMADAPAPALARQVDADAGVIDDPVINTNQVKSIIVPARANRWGAKLKAFKGPNAAADAYTSGMWLCAVFGNKNAERWCNEHGVALIESVHQENVNTTGGYLVPDVLYHGIIELVKEYGVFRREAGIYPMTSDRLSIPRRTGGLTAYFIGEGDALTESTGSWDDVNLLAKDCGVLTRVSNNLASDAIIPIMDRLTVEIARALALKEDLCGFLGTGLSTHGGIVGVITQLISVAWTAPSVNTGAGLVEWGTGTGFENITLANLCSLMSLLPTYARAGAKWHYSPTFFDAVVTRLVTAAGGNLAQTIIDGVPMTKVLGYPVVLNETMNSVGTDQMVSCLFGDLTLATSFGDRAQIEIATSDSANIGGQSMFERNQKGLRAIERFDITANDVGTSSAPGPIVGLMCYDAA